MSPLEYIGDALDMWPLYACLLCLFVGVHVLLARRWTIGIFDPLLVLLFANAFSWTIVWFMYLRGDISSTYVISFTVCEIALYAGMELAKPRVDRLALNFRASRQDLPTAKLVLASAWVFHVFSTFGVWLLAGIPLLRDSRLGGFEGSGGLGLVERLSDSSGLIAIFAAIYILATEPRSRRKGLYWLFFIWYFLAAALSGSKSAFLVLGQQVLSVVFVYTALHSRRDSYWGGRFGKLLFSLSAAFAVLILATQQEGDFERAALGFVYRIVSYGDVFVFAYPDATIEALKGDNPLVGMFGGFLSTLRLFPQDAIYPNLGYQFTGLIFPDLDLIAGPNPQHPIFGYHYFGIYAPVFSFCLGLLTRVVHSGYYVRRHTSFLSGLLRFSMLFMMITISIDFEYALTKLASFLFGLALVVAPALFLFKPQAVLLRRRMPRTRLSTQST